MTSVRDAARTLLQQRLRALVPLQCDHKGVLFRLEKGGTRGHFLAQETWINVNLGDASATQLEPLRALVKIIARLSTSDELQWQENYHSFWKPALMDLLVCSICTESAGGIPDPSQFDNYEELTSSNGPRFLLDFQRSLIRRSQVDVLRSFLFEDDDGAIPDPYKEVEQELLSKLTPRPRQRSRTKAPRIELELSLANTGLTIPSDLRVLAKFLEDVAEREQSNDCTQYPAFEISALTFPPDKLLVPIEIDILTDMIASETPTIRHLSLVSAMMMLSVTKRLRVFQQLLRTTACLLPDSEPTLKTLHLENVPLLQPPVASICSVLRHANSLKDLHLQWTPAEAPMKEKTSLMWGWIAFGIFHPDSEAKLDRLNLSGLPLSYESLTTFASVLRSPHPGRQLWILEHGDLPQGADCEEVPLPVGQRAFVQLTADTKIRMSPKARAKALEPVALVTDEFEVAIELATWVCLVVPGCGFGWVPSASIVSRREMPSKCPTPEDAKAVIYQTRLGKWPLAGANVKTFDRDRVGEIDECENIKFLLQMIGHCLDGFNFPNHHMHISDTDLKEILVACPNLTHLNVSGNFVCSISALVDRYQTKQCRIVSLSVASDWSQAQILSELADLLENPCSRPLRYVASSAAVDSSESMSRLASALKNNPTLRVLFFYSANVEHSEILSEIRSSFEASRITAGLPMSRKLAFISVIQPQSTKSPSSAALSSPSSLERLDSSIVSQVFAFAGTRIPRTFFW